MKESRIDFPVSAGGSGVCRRDGFSEPVRAEVSVNINLGPPPILVSAPPAVVMIPQSQVYFVPDPQIDVFFYAGTGGRRAGSSGTVRGRTTGRGG